MAQQTERPPFEQAQSLSELARIVAEAWERIDARLREAGV